MIKLFTDSSANLPKELTEKYGISVIPFSVIYENGECQNATEDFDCTEFYLRMRKNEKISTSMINTETYESYFEKELISGNDIIYVGMSGGISGAQHAAECAKDALKEKYPKNKITVIDTFGASLGEGLLVLDGAKMLASGVSYEDVCDFILTKRHTVCQYFTVDNLEYLKRGGRISGTAATVGNLLDIKPLLTGDSEGHIVSYGKARGRNRALKELAKKFALLCADRGGTVGIAHADDLASAETLLKMLREFEFTGECITVCYEPVTGAHVGPGTVALFFNGIRK